MSTPRDVQSPFVVLPPIISNDRDREFLRELTTYIDNELSSVDATNPDQRYIIHRAAFDKVIEHVTAYKPLLTAIKAEYEECIETILRGKQEAFYLHGKLKAMATEASTVRNYKKRCDELTDRINIVRGNNEILRDELDQLRAARHPASQTTDSESDISGPTKTPRASDKRFIPGLTIEECTDPEFLEEELSRLQRLLRDLQVARHIQYQPKLKSDQLKNKLEEKERKADQCARDEVDLKRRLAKLKVAYEAARMYNGLAGPYTQESIGDVILDALRRYKKGENINETLARINRGQDLPGGTDLLFDDDDPVKEREADAVMDYIHKFNELFDDQKFSSAAVHAANSPQAILVTMQTLHKFKAASPAHPHGSPPLLQFACAVMAAARALKVRPGEEMAREFVRCALDNGKLDVLQHWVGHQLFTAKEDIGDMIYEHCRCTETCLCSCQAMAQAVYMYAQCHIKSVRSMLRQGRIKQAYQHGKANGCFDRETTLDLLRQYGNTEFAGLLLSANQESRLPVGVVALALIDRGLEREACDLISEMVDEAEGFEFIDKEMNSADTGLSEDDWWRIALKCSQHGHHDVSTHVMAAMTVRSAITTATILIQGSGI